MVDWLTTILRKNEWVWSWLQITKFPSYLEYTTRYYKVFSWIIVYPIVFKGCFLDVQFLKKNRISANCVFFLIKRCSVNSPIVHTNFILFILTNKTVSFYIKSKRLKLITDLSLFQEQKRYGFLKIRAVINRKNWGGFVRWFKLPIFIFRFAMNFVIIVIFIRYILQDSLWIHILKCWI